jgi:hypothetical protein
MQSLLLTATNEVIIDFTIEGKASNRFDPPESHHRVLTESSAVINRTEIFLDLQKSEKYDARIRVDAISVEYGAEIRIRGLRVTQLLTELVS